ncbi:MAG: hypothetical protein QXG83_00070 [Candidatus Pacearchaeota archaeon]
MKTKTLILDVAFVLVSILLLVDLFFKRLNDLENENKKFRK